jgi:3'(2'), 5'-bisphosphate nucleotidase
MTDIQQIITIARQAGEIILQVYQQDFAVMDKADHSPVTQADLQAHQHIQARLHALTPEWPVLSEESPPQEIAERLRWRRYWLVDPLDGTREFIKKNGEFTVNIALIDNGNVVLGVVHAPVPGTTWWGEQGKGAYRQQGSQALQPLRVSEPPFGDRQWRVVGSRSHVTPQQQAFMQRLPGAQLMSVGSSIKLCMVAEGSADLYPKFGPTSEWDTAAGQAVVEAAGGQVLAWPGLTPLRYNQRPDTLINPDFMACARPDDYWALGGEKDSAAFPG